MSFPLRTQVLVLPNLPWPAMVERFRKVEELGFDLAVTGDHFCDWTNPSSPWLEMWTLLAGIAQATTRIRLAPCVAQIPLRNPAMLAREALTVDHISAGRLEVGLGLGLPIDPSYDMIGVENWSNKERADRFGEYVHIVKEMLSNDITSFTGHFYQVKDATMVPRSSQRPHPPITVAALGPRMIGLAAKYADTWNTMSFAKDFEQQLAETKTRIAQANAACERIQRDPGSLRISYNMFDAASRASGGHISYYESEQSFHDMANQLIALGVRELGLYFPMREEQVPMFERIALNVIPELKKAA